MENYFESSAGTKLKIKAVPMLLLEEVRLRAMENIPLPPLPTYQVEILDGSLVPYEHDEKSIQDDKTTPEEKAAWTAYQAVIRDRQSAAANKVMELLLAKGVELEREVTSIGDWVEIQNYFGIRLPENPIALKIHYLKTEVLTGPDDIQRLIGKVMEASGIDPKLLQAARNSFRDNLRSQQYPADGTSGETQSGVQGEVEDISEISRVGAGESMEPIAQ